VLGVATTDKIAEIARRSGFNPGTPRQVTTADRKPFGIVGVGAVACAACCAGPVLAFLGGLGALGVIGTVWFGVIAAAVVAAGAAAWIAVRRRRRASCREAAEGPVPVAPPVRQRSS